MALKITVGDKEYQVSADEHKEIDTSVYTNRKTDYTAYSHFFKLGP